MIEIFKNIDSLELLKSDWNTLADEAGTPTLTYEWINAAAESFLSPREELQILGVLGQDGVLLAAAPLFLTKLPLRRRLLFVGNRELWEPTGFLYRSPESLTELIRGVLSLGYPLQIQRLAFESQEKTMLEQLSRGLRLVIAQEEDPSLFVPLSPSWEAFERSITGSRRERIRRAKKRAANFGQVHFETLAASDQNFERLYSTFASIECLSWKGQLGTALLKDKRYFDFFRNFAMKILTRAPILFSFLRLGEKYAAAQLSVVFSGKLWILKIGYDKTYSTCSPGLLLMHEVIRHAFSMGLSSVELLGKHEPWLTIWTKNEHRYCHLRSYGLNFSSVADLLICGTSKVLGQARRAICKDASTSNGSTEKI